MNNSKCSMSKKKESLIKKFEANIDDLKGMVVSEGTMGVNALIRKYLAVLETYAPDNYKAYIEANPELKDRDVWMALDVEDKSYIVDELANELDKIAPEGYYFGASEGDGACYGFWEVEPDESKKCEGSNTPEDAVLRIFTMLKDNDILAGYIDMEVVKNNLADLVEEFEGRFDFDTDRGSFVATMLLDSNDERDDESVIDKWNRCADMTDTIMELFNIPNGEDSTNENWGAIQWELYDGGITDIYTKDESKKSEVHNGLDMDSKYRYIDEFENLIGMDISDAHKEMGGWWTLANQDVRGSLRSYDFKRSGLGAVTLTADKNNNVVKVSGRILQVPFEFSQKKQGESKKSEGVSDTIKMNIDYNTFMRLLDATAYLDADDDYKDALWDYYSEFGELDGDACGFFDNLFQYTDWYDADEVWENYDNILGTKPEDKDAEEALDAYLEEHDADLGGASVYKHGDHYLILQ